MFRLTGKLVTVAARSGWGLLLVLAVSGCGRVGQVSGTVTYRNQSLPDGTVMLLASDGRVYDGQIQPDGSFRIAAVPAGPAKVRVTSLAVSGQAEKEGAGREEGRGKHRMLSKVAARSRIPAEYGDFDRSGLTVTVEKGKTATLELNLK